jgi:peptide/nickel transport system permease protein
VTAPHLPLWTVGAGLVTLLALTALLAPVLAPHDPAVPSGPSFAAPSPEHLLGTNNLGQDVVSRLMWGAQASLTVAAGATALAVGIGVAVGVAAGLAGGLADVVAMRVVDVLVALPRLPLLVLVAALSGAGGPAVAVLIGLLAWAPIARVLRGQTLSLRNRGYVHAARGFGGGPAYLVRRHLVPALAPLVVAEVIVVAGNAVLLEASLAFLGLADPTTVSWGLDINRALTEPGVYFTPAWLWWVLPTGVVISLAIGSFTVLGVGLEPLLNPRVERRS